MKGNLSVVIPCKNEENYILETLKSIARQIGSEGLKVIIADGGSTDSTLDLIKAHQKKSHLEIEIVQGGRVAEGRNNGAMKVTTDVVCFIDSDVRLKEPDVLQSAYDALMLGKSLVTCKLAPYPFSFPLWISHTLFNFIQKNMKESFAVGGFICVRISDFKEKGGFNEEIDHSEDFFFSRKFLKKDFFILKKHFTQDDRRIKKMGYFNFLKFLLSNWLKKENIDHFKKPVYWN